MSHHHFITTTLYKPRRSLSPSTTKATTTPTTRRTTTTAMRSNGRILWLISANAFIFMMIQLLSSPLTSETAMGTAHAYTCNGSAHARSKTSTTARQRHHIVSPTSISSSSSDNDVTGSSSLSSSSPSRRDFVTSTVTVALTSMMALGGTKTAAGAEDSDSSSSDLTTQLFNADGSLKEGVESEIKFRNVKFTWDSCSADSDGSDCLSVNRDGKDIIIASKGVGAGSRNDDDNKKIQITYEYPLRWSDGSNGDPIYFDRSEGTNAKACKRITVYRSSGLVDSARLEQATKLGVAKAFNIPKGNTDLDLDRLYGADIISAKTTDRNQNTYYEFDMASAPTTCGDSKENLGLGFCPYDLIYLVSATVVNDRLYCIIVECDDTKIWKLDSSELKRLRSSFTVEEVA